MKKPGNRFPTDEDAEYRLFDPPVSAVVWAEAVFGNDAAARLAETLGFKTRHAVEPSQPVLPAHTRRLLSLLEELGGFNALGRRGVDIDAP